MQGTCNLLQPAEDATPSSLSDSIVVCPLNQRALLLRVARPSRRRHVERSPSAVLPRHVASHACAVLRVGPGRAVHAEAARCRVAAIAAP